MGVYVSSLEVCGCGLYNALVCMEFEGMWIMILNAIWGCDVCGSVVWVCMWKLKMRQFLQSFKPLWFRVTPLDVLTFCLFRKWGQERNKNCWEEEEEGCSLVYLLTSSMYVLEIDKFCNIASTSMCFSLVFKVSTNSVCFT